MKILLDIVSETKKCISFQEIHFGCKCKEKNLNSINFL